MSKIAIRVENLSKKYRIGLSDATDLRNAFGNFISKIKNKKSRFRNSENIAFPGDFWALKDINFEVKKGHALGIIGRNGAGKSTLLKILSRITEPTSGYFTLEGRVSSLLEVGTGFHMELTGRENVYLNGTILGMRRREVREKFDEIVEFSGVKQFIDTPVKHYSSGMKVRLAFSVAAHLEPEILMIDEVLAVGDSEFQKKCLGKMEDVTGQGRTVLFVSHNLVAVNQLCQSGLLLSDGNIVVQGPVAEVIHKYISNINTTIPGKELQNLHLRKGDGNFRVEHIELLNDHYQPVSMALTGSDVIFEIQFNRTISKDEGSFRIDFAIDNEYNFRIGWFSSEAVLHKISNEFNSLFLKIPKLPYGSGTYTLTFYATMNGLVVDYIHQGYVFRIEDGDFFGTGKIIPKTQTFMYTDHQIYSAE